MAGHTRRGTVFGSRDRGRLLRTCAPPSARGSLLGSSFVLPFWFGGRSEASPPSVVGTGRRHGSCGSPSAAGPGPRVALAGRARAAVVPGAHSCPRRSGQGLVCSRQHPRSRVPHAARSFLGPPFPVRPVAPGPYEVPPATRGSDLRAGRRAAEACPTRQCRLAREPRKPARPSGRGGTKLPQMPPPRVPGAAAVRSPLSAWGQRPRLALGWRSHRSP